MERYRLRADRMCHGVLSWRQVAAALAKSSTISVQLLHATSVDDDAPGAIQRRDSVSSISSDDFHDAESGDEMADSE